MSASVATLLKIVSDAIHDLPAITGCANLLRLSVGMT